MGLANLNLLLNLLVGFIPHTKSRQDLYCDFLQCLNQVNLQLMLIVRQNTVLALNPFHVCFQQHLNIPAIKDFRKQMLKLPPFPKSVSIFNYNYQLL